MRLALSERTLSGSIHLVDYTLRLLHALYRHRVRWFLGIASLLVTAHFFTLGLNVGESLPGTVYLIHKTDRDVRTGDVVAFRWHGGGPYDAGLTFTKIVAGVAGDTVRFVGRDVYINDVYLASAKPFSRNGTPLVLGPTGVIPPNRFYVYAPHPDSLDSRYAITGWIDTAEVIGRAQRLF